MSQVRARVTSLRVGHFPLLDHTWQEQDFENVSSCSWGESTSWNYRGIEWELMSYRELSERKQNLVLNQKWIYEKGLDDHWLFSWCHLIVGSWIRSVTIVGQFHIRLINAVDLVRRKIEIPIVLRYNIGTLLVHWIFEWKSHISHGGVQIS